MTRTTLALVAILAAVVLVLFGRGDLVPHVLDAVPDGAHEHPAPVEPEPVESDT